MRYPYRSAFTLVEVLTSMAAFALISMLLFQMVNQTAQSTGIVHRQLDAAASRRALDALASDLSVAVTTGGAAILVQPQSAFAFLVRGRGPSDAPDSRFLAVSYWLENETLYRGYAPIPSTQSDLLVAATQAYRPPLPTEVATGVLRVVFTYETDENSGSATLPSSAVLGSGSDFEGNVVPPDWSVLLRPASPADLAQPRVTALTVTIAALDEKTLQLLESSGNASALKFLLADPSTEEQIADLPGFWQTRVNEAAHLPAPVRNGLQILQTTIPL